MTQRLQELSKKNLEFHKRMSDLHHNRTKVAPETPSQSLLPHPYTNRDSVFFGRKDLEDNAFIELTKDQLSADKFLFDFEEEDCSNLIPINHF